MFKRKTPATNGSMSRPEAVGAVTDTRRPETATGGPESAAADETEHLRLAGVSLLTNAPEGMVRIPDLSLLFDANGLTVSKASGEVVKVMPWNEVSGLGTEQQLDRPAEEVLLRVSSGGRSHRFVINEADRASFDERLTRLAYRYRGAPRTAYSSGRTPSAEPRAWPPPPAGPQAPAAEPAAVEPAAAEPAAGEPAAAEPGTPEPGTAEPGTAEPAAPDAARAKAAADAAAAGETAGATAMGPSTGEGASTSVPEVRAPGASTETEAAQGERTVPSPSASGATAPASSATGRRAQAVAPESAKGAGPRAPQEPASVSPWADPTGVVPRATPAGPATGATPAAEARAPRLHPSPLPVTAVTAPEGKETLGGTGVVTEPRVRSGWSLRRKLLLSAGIVLLVCVLAFLGLYFAQREGAIDILPHSIVTPPSSSAISHPSRAPNAASSRTAASPAVAGSSRGQADAHTSAGEIPGMTMGELTGIAESQGFSCSPVGTTSFNCTRPNQDAVIHIESPDGQSVNSVSVTAIGVPNSSGFSSLLQAIGSAPYQGASPIQASQWVASNIGQSSKTTIGPVSFDLVVSSNKTLLELSDGGPQAQ